MKIILHLHPNLWVLNIQVKFQQQILFVLKWEENACHHFGRSKIYPNLGLKQAPQQSFLITPFTVRYFAVNPYGSHLN